MATTGELTRELAQAYRARRPPQFDLASVEAWVKVIDKELGKGNHDLAQHAVKTLREREPDLEWAQTMHDLLERMEAEGPLPERFYDDPDKDVQVVPRAGADAIILAFCDIGGRLAMPLSMFQRWLSALPASVAYLRDFQRFYYMNGITSLGADRAETLVALRGLAAELGARRILCLGNSAGGFAAMRYGLELGADSVLSLAGHVNLGFNMQKRASVTRDIQKRWPDEVLDLRTLYMAAARKPHLILAYGDNAWDDRLHAEYMAAGVPEATLLSIEGHAKHGVVAPLVKRKEFDKVLARFFAAHP